MVTGALGPRAQAATWRVPGSMPLWSDVASEPGPIATGGRPQAAAGSDVASQAPGSRQPSGRDPRTRLLGCGAGLAGGWGIALVDPAMLR